MSALLVVFYADPDGYPPTVNAVRLLAEHFRVRILARAEAQARGITWPEGIRIDRLGPGLSTRERDAAPAADKLREYLAFILAVRRALAEDRPSVVYAYEPHALGALALSGCRAPIVYHRHESEAPFVWKNLQSWIGLLALRRAPRAELVVFPERLRAAEYQRLSGDDRPPLVVPNFPLRAAFPPPDLAALIPERLRGPVAHYRGAVGSENGIVQMVGALRHLSPAISLRVSGRAEPAFVRELEGLAASLGCAGRLRYDGFVPFEQLNVETARSAVGLVLYQAVSNNLTNNVSATNKLYEYAACGLPVVVPDRPAFREFLAGEAWVEYADARDPASIARAIEACLSGGPARYEQRARAARRAFEERLNFEAVFGPLLDRILRMSTAPRDRTAPYSG